MIDCDFVKAVWVNLNSNILSIDDAGYLCCWDVDSETCVSRVKLADAPLTDIKLSLDRSFAVITSRDSKARLVRVDDLTILKTYTSDRPLNACAISPILNHVLLAGGQEATDVTLSGAGEGHFEVEFWHTIYEEKLTQVTGHFGPVNTLAISRDGQMFASGGEDGNVRLYQFDEGYLNSKY